MITYQESGDFEGLKMGMDLESLEGRQGVGFSWTIA